MTTCGVVREDFLKLVKYRLEELTNDDFLIDMFMDMYDDEVYSDWFVDNYKSISEIVDEDFVNNCFIVYPSDEAWMDCLNAFSKKGRHFVSSYIEDKYSIQRIEAVDNEDNPQAFLVRHIER